MNFLHKKIAFFVFLFSLSGICRVSAQVNPSPSAPSYGSNDAAGSYVQVNGIRMYYEVYGRGEPMIIIHDNGGDIKSMQKQIPAFSAHYKVIVADSRGHGKSRNDGRRLTYELMAADWTALLDSLHLDSVYVFGWGSGGTIGLLMAINSPARIRKLAVVGANLEPDSTALTAWFRNWISTTGEFSSRKLQAGDTTQNWKHMEELLDLLGKQPHIRVEHLHSITAPTLVMCGDRDLVRNEHTVKIFENIPNAHLCIIPGATHMLPWEDTDVMNQTIINFFRQPFQRPDTREYY